MIRSKLIRIYRKPAEFFLVILFCGYLGSITFFPHTHIVDGITVVHSHPYKSHSGNYPINHSHSKNGFLLIQFISGFISATPVLFFGVLITRKLLCNYFFNQDKTVILSFYLPGACRPRAPAA
jgi:hypothetical protein